jgi:hypothetical protein
VTSSPVAGNATITAVTPSHTSGAAGGRTALGGVAVVVAALAMLVC